MQGDHLIITRKITGLFGMLFIISAISGTASGEYYWSNDISIQNDGIVWKYTEHISGMDSYVFKYDIDNKQGNNDRFVSAWELAKADKQMRNRFQESLNKRRDMKFNNSPEGIILMDIDAVLSVKALGRVNDQVNFTNVYLVRYRLSEGLLSNSNTLWLLGEPDSELFIDFPQGTQIQSTSGIQNATMNPLNISGRFNDTLLDRGEALVTYHFNPIVNQSGLLEEEGDAGTPFPTQVPFLWIGHILLVLLAAILLSKS